MNEESLTRQLSNPKSSAVAVVVYSNKYGPSMKVYEHVKRLIEASPSIQILPVNADEHGHILSAPILNITDIPSVVLFYQGSCFAGPLTDIYQITDSVKRLAIVSMEIDDFDCIGTNVRAASVPEMQKWSASGSVNGGIRVPTTDIFQPLYAVMDSLYDI